MTDAVLHPLRPLFAPQHIAVVGASPKGGYGLTTLENLRGLGFPGRLDVIHPRLSEVAGVPAVPSLADLDAVPDAVAVAVPAAAVPEVLAQAAALGVPTGVVYASGFAELEDGGGALQRQMIDACGDRLRIVGPNCLGTISYQNRAALWGITMPLARGAGEGSVALAAQSGNMVLTLLNSGRLPQIAYAVSAGNQAVVDVLDCLEFYLTEPTIRVIALIIEGLRDLSRFRRLALRAAEAGVGVVVLKVGRSTVGSRATVAHTGTLAGRDGAYDALFAQTGVIRVDDLDELVSVCSLLAGRVPLRGTRLGIFASSGGECGLIADLAESVGVTLPDLAPETVQSLAELVPSYGSVRNPFDLTAGGWGQHDIYASATAALGRAPDIDVVAFVGDNPVAAGDPGEAGWQEMTSGAGKAAVDLDVPVALVTTTSDTSQDLVDMARDEGLVVLTGLRPALRAISLIGARRTPAPQAAIPVGAVPAVAAELLARATGTIDETTAKRILAEYGIATPAGGLATGREEAAALAQSLGFPVVAKVSISGLAHKSDLGGVLLNLADADDVRAGYDRLADRSAGHHPGRPFAVRIERMAPRGGVEMIIGGSNDDAGSLVVIGAGGTLAEVLADVGRLLWPFDENEVADIVARLRCAPLLAGYRGGSPADVPSLARCAVAVGRLLADFPQIAEIDVNPLQVDAEGALALDALLVISPPTTAKIG